MLTVDNHTFPFNLIEAMLGTDKYNNIIYIQGVFDKINTLRPIEKEYIKHRFIENRPRKECGEIIGIVGARELEVRTLRKIRAAWQDNDIIAIPKRHYNTLSSEHELLQKDYQKLMVLIDGLKNKTITPNELIRDNTDDIFKTKQAIHEELLDTSIWSLNLSRRTANGLFRAGAKTLRDIITKSDDELLERRGFGEKSLIELKGKLESYGLKLNANEEG